VGRNDNIAQRWARLVLEAQECRACPRMECSKRVLTDRNGPYDAPIMFVAEAPGRLGAERTGIPLFGDRTGDRFEALLSEMGWKRCDVFLTNAVLCNPRDEDGNNDAPSTFEIRNCSTFLARTIDVVNPALVIALGNVALRALALLEAHALTLGQVGGRLVPWRGRLLATLYHPGPRSAVHRAWELQLRDAGRLAAASGRAFGRSGELSRHRAAREES
jgi:uracil-DNA glycosylase